LPIHEQHSQNSSDLTGQGHRLFTYHQWTGNPRILDAGELKNMPFTAIQPYLPLAVSHKPK
jgi:hypothetical protein